jgi:hypothetical protein
LEAEADEEESAWTSRIEPVHASEAFFMMVYPFSATNR